MSFNNIYGFTPEDSETILGRIISNLLAVVPDMAVDPSSIVFQWAKILASEMQFMEQLIEKFTANMTVVGADEFYTMLHGTEVGVYRKLATNATGYVKVNANVGARLQTGTKFWTSDGIYFDATEDETWTDNITIQRGRNESDGIPFQYPDFVPAALYYDQSMASGTEINSGAWWYESGSIWWRTHDPTYSGYVPSFGSYYYAVPSGGAYYINVPVECETGGTIGNVGAGSITNYDSSTTTGTINSVTNDYAFTNGTDVEPLDEYKRRILAAKRVPTNIDYLSSLANQVAGVKYAKLYEVMNDDICYPASGWEDLGSGIMTYKGMDDPNTTYSFTFSPSDGVATLKGITIWTNAEGTPGNLEVYLCVDNGSEQSSDSAIASTSVDIGVLNRMGRTTQQAVFIPLIKNGISKSVTYRVFIKPYNCDVNNHWNLYYDSSTSGNSYVGNIVDPNGEFIRKTHYLAPAFNVVIEPNPGNEFETVRNSVISAIDDYVPIGVQYEIYEARKVYLSLMVDIVPEEGSDMDGVRNQIISAVSDYLSSLKPGDDVIYSQIEKAILSVDGVFKEKNLEIWINDNPHSTPDNEMDQFVDFDEIVVLDTSNYYGGVTISEVPT